MERVGNLFYAHVGIVHKEYAAAYDGLEDVLLGCHARHLLHYGRKIFCRYAQLVGIEGHAAFPVVVLLGKFQETYVYVGVACRHRRVRRHHLAEYGADAIGKRQHQQHALFLYEYVF